MNRTNICVSIDYALSAAHRPKKSRIFPIFILYFIYDSFVYTCGHRFCEWIRPPFMWFTKFYFNNQHSINFGLMFESNTHMGRMLCKKWISWKSNKKLHKWNRAPLLMAMESGKWYCSVWTHSKNKFNKRMNAKNKIESPTWKTNWTITAFLFVGFCVRCFTNIHTMLLLLPL